MKKLISAIVAATIASPVVTIPTVAATATAITTIATPTSAGAFPGMGKIIGDTLPCDAFLSHLPSDCILIRERVNIFQGLRGSKPAIKYCREKYGSNASVVWKLGLRWCATPYREA